jgi:hypothetical protein
MSAFIDMLFASSSRARVKGAFGALGALRRRNRI